ncbi:MAG: hypothetical protein IPO33_05865 [Saprospiraceae bacterium]|nr:hypothetical protein [Candidatus Brachybacter algidus]
MIEIIPFEQPKPLRYISKSKQPDPESWELQLNDLEKYFTELILPKEPILLSPGVTIFKVDTFMQSHLDTLKANEGNKYFLPHLNRLQDLKSIIDKLS